jgi:hypothetical protein
MSVVSALAITSFPTKQAPSLHLADSPDQWLVLASGLNSPLRGFEGDSCLVYELLDILLMPDLNVNGTNQVLTLTFGSVIRYHRVTVNATECPKEAKMLSLNCTDMGIKLAPGEKASDHVVTGNTADEVVKKSMEHAKTHHADMLKTMTTPAQMAEMEKQLRSKIK